MELEEQQSVQLREAEQQQELLEQTEQEKQAAENK